MSDTPTDHDTNPMQSTLDAWKVLIAPDNYQSETLSALLQRGLDTFPEHRRGAELIDTAEQFTLESIATNTPNEVIDDPWVPLEYPGRLAMLHVTGVMLIKHNPRLHKQRHRVKLHTNVRTIVKKHIAAALDDDRYNSSLQAYLAAHLFGRDMEDPYGPPVIGPPITGVVTMERFGGGRYFEMPLVHANENALIRATDDPDGPVESRIWDNCLYIPIGAIHDKFDDYIDENAGKRTSPLTTLEKAYIDRLTDDLITQYVDWADDLDSQIKKYEDTYQTDKLFYDKKYPTEIRIILDAVHEAPNDVAALNNWITASDIFNAVRWYRSLDPEDEDTRLNSYEQNILEDIDNARSISMQLSTFESNNEDDDSIQIKENRGNKNEFYLSYSPRAQATTVDVSSIEDILELPCMENLHNLLMEENPHRWILYTFVRVILSLDPNREAGQFNIDDIVDWFSNYPWFNEEITRRQAAYERDRRMPGRDNRKPLPISCNNDNDKFAQFCIGKANCEYSIYKSLPMKEEVYERME